MTALVLIILGSMIYWLVRRKGLEERIIMARKKITRSQFHIYINNFYDEEEFHEKIRKVQMADANQMNLDCEDDLSSLPRIGFGAGRRG